MALPSLSLSLQFGDLADAAQRSGLRLGFYHSIMDWKHPDYRPIRSWETVKPEEKDGDLPRYLESMKGQLRELLSNYGDVATIWFDGEWEHKPEEIIGKLREAEIVLAQGGTVADACRRIGVTEQSYYRWRKEYGGLKMDQARRMKELEKENARLRRAVSDLTLDKLILQEAARGNF